MVERTAMQAQRRTAAFLLPGMLLFFGLTVVLFRSPMEYPVIVLLFFSFVLATGFGISLEMASVFAVLVTMIELGAIGFVQGSDKGWVAGQLVVLWAGVYLAQRFTQRDKQDEQLCSDGLHDRQQSMYALQKEKESL